MESKPIDFFGYLLITIFLLLLTYAGYLSYKSIDWTVLKRLESQELILPTPLLTPSTAALSPTPSSKPVTKSTPSPNRQPQN